MVTFGGSCLNRASALRGSDEARPLEGDLFLVHWRGKFAVDLKNACEIALLRYPHKLISHEKILFLGKNKNTSFFAVDISKCCLLYTSPSPRDVEESRMPSSA